MLVLGIESTAHTFGIAILKGSKILANARSSYTTEKGGMIPAKVAQHHEDAYVPTLQQALAKANVKLDDIDLVAYSNAPGLGHALRIGAAAAKSIALRVRAPLVPVNHAIAHLEIARLVTKAKDPVLLYASGANTQVIAYDEGKYRVFGETLDIGVGNFLDTLARNMGLGFPGGPKVEALAARGNKLIMLPYSIKGMDVSFAGLETHTKRLLGKHASEDIAYSAQEHVFAMLVEAAERAMAHLGKEELALGGGVACNARLQQMCHIMCRERNARCFIPASEFLVDNAAMIAWAGCLMHTRGKISVPVAKAAIDPYERTDDVDVTWR
jgi:glycoprotease/Kae1 family metallohydrolase